MQRNQSIDLFRLIAALFVILLHVNLDTMDESLASGIRMCGRWAVPFFFLSTGYFMRRKISPERSMPLAGIEKNILRLISILLVSSVVYLAYSLVFDYHFYANDVKMTWHGSFWHLWFIGSLIFGYLFIWYVHALGAGRWMLSLSILILLLVIFSDSYDQFLGLSIIYEEFPRLLIGVPFMYIGYRISLWDFSKKTMWVVLLLTAVGFALQFVEMHMFRKQFDYPMSMHQFLIGTAVFVVGLFILITKLKVRPNIFSGYGQRYSLFIYLYHVILIRFAYTVFRRGGVNLDDHVLVPVLIPVLVFLLTLGGAILLDRISPRLFNIFNGEFRKPAAK